MKTVIHLLFFLLLSQISLGQECLNVNYKLRGYFLVGSSKIDDNAPGGFYEHKNKPKIITEEIATLTTKEELKLFVKTASNTEFIKGVKGFKVFIINATDSIIKLPAQDSRLNLKRQVFYKNKWQDIEYLPSSWCGNSYHNVYIKPNEYWDLSAPCIEGKIKAKFRFQLELDDSNKIYSNEFTASFNKRQLKKEQGHTPVDIMDPYDN